MRKMLFCILLAGCTQLCLAQTVVKGKVTDTLEKKDLQNAVVSLLKRSDSSLTHFTRTGRNGEFLVRNVIPATMLLVSCADLAE